MIGGGTDAVQLAGRMITVTLLRVLEPSLDGIAAQLDRRLRAAPGVAGLPAVLDLEPLGARLDALDLPRVAELVRERGITLLGLRDSGEAARTAAQAAGLTVVHMEGARMVHRGTEAEKKPAPADAARTLTVTQPVRSGQQVYARGADLVLLGPVSAGAEVMADGNIHAYGRLRGRAVAGAQGDREARIYCQRLEAELLAVAGYYRLNEGGAFAHDGPVQVRLAGESLLIEPL